MKKLETGVEQKVSIEKVYPLSPMQSGMFFHWLLDKDSHIQAFCFDLIMSSAYIDATSGIEKSIEQCNKINGKYNSHLGFINLCSPCYTNSEKWSYQKAVKPQSGADSLRNFIHN